MEDSVEIVIEKLLHVTMDSDAKVNLTYSFYLIVSVSVSPYLTLCFLPRLLTRQKVV